MARTAEKLSEDEKAAKQKEARERAAARQREPKPAYILINLPEGVNPDDIQVVDSTRKAEDALAAIDSGKASKYLRIMIK